MDMNRRTFLKAGAATALGLALSGAFPTKTTAHAEEAVSLPEDFASMIAESTVETDAIMIARLQFRKLLQYNPDIL